MGGNLLYDVLRAATRGHEHREFARLDCEKIITYGEFFSGAARFASVLADHGLEPGDRVAAQVPKSIEALQLYVGTVIAGGVFLPLNTAYTPSELEHFLGDATPTIVVCDPGSFLAISELTTSKVLTLNAESSGTLVAEAASSEEFAPQPRGADDLAAILYTSGTTGKPKGAMLSHGNLASNAKTLADVWEFTADDTLIHALPIFHTHGLFVATNVTLVAGSSLIFQPSFNAEQIMSVMPNATVLMGVPTFYTRLLQEDGLSQAAKTMRLFVSGSAPLLAETHVAWRERTGTAILERYGMTETNMNTSNPYAGERRAGTVGMPLPGVDLRLTDGKGTTVPSGEPGIVEVRGANVFQGYWNLPEKTAEELLSDGFFVTGDIGEFDDEGYLHIVGRAKDLVITGGYNVYPKEVEQLIDACPGVVESAIVGIPHPDFGEAVVAMVVPESPGSADPEAILVSIGPQLARYKQPKKTIIVEQLPRNAMGKVQKAELRKEYGGLFAP